MDAHKKKVTPDGSTFVMSTLFGCMFQALNWNSFYLKDVQTHLYIYLYIIKSLTYDHGWWWNGGATTHRCHRKVGRHWIYILVMEVILRFRPWIYRRFMSCCFQLSYIVIVLLTWSQVWKHFRWDTLLVQGRHLCKCMELGETWYQYPLPDTVSHIIYVYILIYVNSIDILNSRMDWYGECCFWNGRRLPQKNRATQGQGVGH